MNKKFMTGLVTAIALAAGSLSAQATPITYTLNGVTFADGATASGSFTFDSTTHQSSSFNITTTPGIMTAFTWNKFDSGLYYGGGAGPNNFTLITTNGQRVFNFSFINPFTDAGGTFAINTASTYECYNCNPFRRVNAGSVTSLASTDVPEPATLAMILPAIGALAVTRRRRKQAAA